MRDINKLHPKVKELAESLVRECLKKGLKISITETLRTKEEQNALYAKGRTAPGNIVTNAPFPKSNHIWGIAFDFCRNDGKGAYNDEGNFFTKVGEVGKQLGLTWGGDFKSIKDRPHFEYAKLGTWSDLQSKYKTPENFIKTFTQDKKDNTPNKSNDKPSNKSNDKASNKNNDKSSNKSDTKNDYVGKLVKVFESGDKGSLSLGCCGNDYGLSCGSYQLTLRWGNCIRFLKKYFPEESSKLFFNNDKSDVAKKEWPGKDYCSSPKKVREVWEACYNKVGSKQFFNYEHEYIKSKYYDAVVKELSGVFNPNTHSRMAQECLWSWSVHKGVGGASRYFKEATKGLNPQKMEGSKLIDILYDKRYAVDSFMRYKKNASGSEREKLRPYCDVKPLV